MKKSTLILSLVAAALTLSTTSCKTGEGKTDEGSAETKAIASGSIVYFDLDKVLDEYDMANDLRSEVETKVAAIQKDVNRRQKNLEDGINDFQNKINKGLMTSAAAADTQKKLQQQEANFQQYAQQKQAEIMEEQQVMMNQIADAIKTFVEQYNEDKKFALILSNQASVPVIAGDPSLNITEEIIAGLNAQYVKTKNEKAE